MECQESRLSIQQGETYPIDSWLFSLAPEQSPCVQPKLAWPVNAPSAPAVNTSSSAPAPASKPYKPPGSVASILETPPLVPQVFNHFSTPFLLPSLPFLLPPFTRSQRL